MFPTELKLEDFTLIVTQEVQVNAPVDVTFEALLEQIGAENERPDGVPMPMVIEPWPGGRWYRDLGDGNGHFWANVQAIKRPTLLEFAGPLFASYPLVSNVQYRLSEKDGGTLITFRHTALGFMQEEQRAGVQSGWNWMLERTRKAAEGRK
jgi:Activator of Hsp90 ATPase homolog 1-like protein